MYFRQYVMSDKGSVITT